MGRVRGKDEEREKSEKHPEIDDSSHLSEFQAGDVSGLNAAGHPSVQKQGEILSESSVLLNTRA